MTKKQSKATVAETVEGWVPEAFPTLKKEKRLNPGIYEGLVVEA
jgi:hypothetical protein